MGNLVKTLIGHEKGVISLSWTGDCSLLSGSWDGTGRMWDISNGTCIRTFPQHENGVHIISLSNSDTIVTTSTGEQVSLE